MKIEIETRNKMIGNISVRLRTISYLFISVLIVSFVFLLSTSIFSRSLVRTSIDIQKKHQDRIVLAETTIQSIKDLELNQEEIEKELEQELERERQAELDREREAELGRERQAELERQVQEELRRQE